MYITVSLHYLVKYIFSKITVITINTYAKTYLIKQLFTNFLILVKFCLVLAVLAVSVNIPYRMGQKLSSRLLLISSPNIDGFYRFYQCYASEQFSMEIYDISHHTKNVWLQYLEK